MCGQYSCTGPKFIIYLHFILTTICTYTRDKVHKIPDYYILPPKPHILDLFSNVVISIFQYKLSITINYVLCKLWIISIYNEPNQWS